jgi:hypothetical protein
MARKLHCQVAGEAIGAFDDDAADAIGRNAVEHALKPGRGNRIGAAYGCIIELVPARWRLSLSLSGPVLVADDVPRPLRPVSFVSS